MSRRILCIGLMAGLVLSGLVGCQGKAQQTDAAAARATLQRALDSWKAGTSLEEFEQSSPAVNVVEPAWRDGTRLAGYDLDGSEKPHGFDLRFKVKLSVIDASGQKSEQTASYTVSTAPALVIVRGEEGQ
jgi:hypothetical protein